MTKVWLVNHAEALHHLPADFFFCRYKSKALTVIIDMVYIICAVPFYLGGTGGRRTRG